VSAAPSPKANPADVFQRIWYRLALLFYTVYLIVFWFVFGPGNPWYAVGVAGWTFQPWARSGRPRDATRASPMVPRAYGRASAPPHGRCRSFQVAARCLGMEPPCGRTYAGIFGQKGRLTVSGAVCAIHCQRPRNRLCHSRTIGRPRAFHQAPVERRTMDAVAGSSGSSLPVASTAVHHASTPASFG